MGSEQMSASLWKKKEFKMKLNIKMRDHTEGKGSFDCLYRFHDEFQDILLQLVEVCKYLKGHCHGI